jgi:hypothetical protein
MKDENTDVTLPFFKGVTISVTLAFLLLVSLPSAALAFQPNDSTNASSSWNHCGIIVSHENAGDNAIQLALNAASDGQVSPPVVCVGPGVYPEQLSITSGGISLVGLGNTWNPTIIEPSSVVVNSHMYNTNFYPDGTAQAAIILVGNGGTGGTLEGVNIVNLVVDGSAASSSWNTYPTACWYTTPLSLPDYAGIFYNGASGSIVGNIIRNVYLPQDMAPCQMGQGVDVGTATSAYTEGVTISNNVISNYGDVAVWCYASGVTCNITGNAMNPYVPYLSLAIGQGGIVIFPGASADIERNIISGNVCTSTPCGSNVITQTQGLGVWTLFPATGTVIKNNIFTDNDLAVALVGDMGTVTGNVMSHNTYDAILAYDGVGTNTMIGNILSQSPVGILVLNDGGVPAFNVNIFSSAFNHVPVLVTITTISPGAATVYFRGHTYTASGTQTIIIK